MNPNGKTPVTSGQNTDTQTTLDQAISMLEASTDQQDTTKTTQQTEAPSAKPDPTGASAETGGQGSPAQFTSSPPSFPPLAGEERPKPTAAATPMANNSSRGYTGAGGSSLVGNELDELIDEDAIPFEQSGVQKLGILGGKGVGKSYLFQAMVYRTCANEQAGSMAYYLDRGNIRLFSALTRNDQARSINLRKFIRTYSSWTRLPQTQRETQRWYRLRLPYRTGLLGLGRSALEVEFFDGSGEGFFQVENIVKGDRDIWKAGYLGARVIVFCLPLWVAFPAADLSQADWQVRDIVLEGFEQVVLNFTNLRERNNATHPVLSILALTMADDRRSALHTLRERWVNPYMDAPQLYLRQLHTGHGIARYLANARKTSDALRQEFATVSDPFVAGIPNKLDFGTGRPWLIPVSAIEGSLLDTIEQRYPDPDQRVGFQPPVPVHVELPLLVALCERENALM